MYQFYTYIIYSRDNKRLETGVTTDLKGTLLLINEGRGEHAKLVYYETFETGWEATERERVFKDIPADMLRQFVRDNNPDLTDLSELIINPKNE